jgi:hypothetical protein
MSSLSRELLVLPAFAQICHSCLLTSFHVFNSAAFQLNTHNHHSKSPPDASEGLLYCVLVI